MGKGGSSGCGSGPVVKAAGSHGGGAEVKARLVGSRGHKELRLEPLQRVGKRSLVVKGRHWGPHLNAARVVLEVPSTQANIKGLLDTRTPARRVYAGTARRHGMCCYKCTPRQRIHAVSVYVYECSFPCVEGTSKATCAVFERGSYRASESGNTTARTGVARKLHKLVASYADKPAMDLAGLEAWLGEASLALAQREPLLKELRLSERKKRRYQAELSLAIGEQGTSCAVRAPLFFVRLFLFGGAPGGIGFSR